MTAGCSGLELGSSRLAGLFFPENKTKQITNPNYQRRRKTKKSRYINNLSIRFRKKRESSPTRSKNINKRESNRHQIRPPQPNVPVRFTPRQIRYSCSPLPFRITPYCQRRGQALLRLFHADRYRNLNPQPRSISGTTQYNGSTAPSPF